MLLEHGMRLTLPTTLNDELGDFAWIARAHESAICASDVVVDFSHCRFVRYNAVAWLGALSTTFAQRGDSLTFDWSTVKPQVRDYLIGCGFARSLSGPNTLFRNAIPYRCDAQRSDAAIARFLARDWLGRGWIDVTDQLAGVIVSRMLEIYLNAFEHADAASGVHSCGFRLPNRGDLGLTVVDLGIGIVERVRSAAGASLSPSDALRWALTPGYSTQAGVRGMGLNELQEFVVLTGGAMSIHSGSGRAVIDSSGTTISDRPHHFSGTLVNVRLRCDDRHYALTSEVGDDSEFSF
jgi:hypothetical protein